MRASPGMSIPRNPLQEKSGRIDYHELKVAIRALGFDIKKAEALRLVEEHDVQGSGTVGLDDFLTIMTAKYSSRDPEQELRKAFELFDAVRMGGVHEGQGAGRQASRAQGAASRNSDVHVPQENAPTAASRPPGIHHPHTDRLPSTHLL
jgi:hypothetical protein